MTSRKSVKVDHGLAAWRLLNRRRDSDRRDGQIQPSTISRPRARPTARLDVDSNVAIPRRDNQFAAVAMQNAVAGTVSATEIAAVEKVADQTPNQRSRMPHPLAR